MIGAIIGDTVGSRFEFDNHRSKSFDLFTEECELTDDSIMTLAVMEIMQRRLYKDKEAIIDTLKAWGRAYPHRGYGGCFYDWLEGDNRNAYNSYGNGAAMRISPVGYYANSEEEVKEAAKAITEVTHNHPEGLKGAEVTAMCIYYAKKGKSKDYIKKYASQYYDLNFNYKKLKKEYYFDVSCQGTVPQAIYAFLISNDFEDAIRTAISIGGDSDTLACITGGIAEAYYKHIDKDLIDTLLTFLPHDDDDCSPYEVLTDYLDERISNFLSFEEIQNNSYVLQIIKEDSKNMEISYLYSQTPNILIDYLIEMSTYNEKLLGYLNLFLKDYINLDLLNDILEIYGEEIQFKIYKSAQEAVSFIMTMHQSVSSDVFTEIFDRKYIMPKK